MRIQATLTIFSTQRKGHAESVALAARLADVPFAKPPEVVARGKYAAYGWNVVVFIPSSLGGRDLLRSLEKMQACVRMLVAGDEDLQFHEIIPKDHASVRKMRLLKKAG
jgi:hypothetical protein